LRQHTSGKTSFRRRSWTRFPFPAPFNSLMDHSVIDSATGPQNDSAIRSYLHLGTPLKPPTEFQAYTSLPSFSIPHFFPSFILVYILPLVWKLRLDFVLSSVLLRFRGKVEVLFSETPPFLQPSKFPVSVSFFPNSLLSRTAAPGHSVHLPRPLFSLSLLRLFLLRR